MTNCNDLPSLPHLPGKWRWTDKHFVNDCKAVRLQRRRFGIWFTQEKSLYWPMDRFLPNTASGAAHKALRSFNAREVLFSKRVCRG
jgi:hypothetical protein